MFMQTADEPIGPRVRAAIKSAGSNRTAVAKAINVPPSTFIRILETDDLPMSWLRAISRELNVPVKSWLEVAA